MHSTGISNWTKGEVEEDHDEDCCYPCCPIACSAWILMRHEEFLTFIPYFFVKITMITQLMAQG